MAQIEVSELEKLDLLRVCQARIFLDIWRMDDLDKVWKMMTILDGSLIGIPDRSDTPRFNQLVNAIRHSPSPLSDLEAASSSALTAVALEKWIRQRKAARSATT
ncbi:MAG: hypothetical protein IJ418_08240 [Clostridia bacterium]|nr:hypothetical protein [Clostridia bacterium]